MILSKLYERNNYAFYGIIVGIIAGLIVGVLNANNFLELISQESGYRSYYFTLAETVNMLPIVVGFIIGFVTFFISTGIRDDDAICLLLFIPVYIYSVFMGYWIVWETGIFAFPLWSILLISFVAVEIIFFLDKKKPVYESKFWFAVKRKLFAICDVVVGIWVANIIYLLVQLIIGFVQLIIDNIPVVLEIFKWIGIVGLGILGVIAYFAVNSLKYRRGKK